MRVFIISWLFWMIQFPLFASIVDQNSALKVAQAHLSFHQCSNDFQISDVSELMNMEGKKVVYIVKLKPQGFLAISANTNINPIICYSFTNNFPMDTDENNILFHMVRNDLDLRLKALPTLSKNMKQDRNRQWDSFLSNNGQALYKREFQQWPEPGTSTTGGWLQTTWHQSTPYNYYCPCFPNTRDRTLVGCVAVALAQVIHYHKTVGDLKFDDVDKYTSAYPIIHIDSDSSKCRFPSFRQLNSYLDLIRSKFNQNQKLRDKDIAALQFACAVLLQTRFSCFGSSASGYQPALILTDRFNFGSAQVCHEIPTLLNKLADNNKNGLPALLTVHLPGMAGGHEIVCDGYNTANEYHLNFGWGEINPGGGTVPIEAWYSLPNEIPQRWNIINGGVVDIISYFGTIEGAISLNNGLGNVVDTEIRAGSAKTHPDEYGNYVLHIAPGIYNVTASLQGYYTETVENVTVEANQIVEQVDFIFEPYNGLTIHVDCQGNGNYLTIQDGINAAKEGDTVLIQDGVYHENIDFIGKNISVGSLFLTTGETSHISKTIINGSNNGSVVTFKNGEDGNAVLCGVTLTNGLAVLGGGVSIYNYSNPHLKNLIIKRNKATSVGGGIYCEMSSPSLTNLVVCENEADCLEGGIQCIQDSHPCITNIVVANNRAKDGGGIRLYNFSDAKLVNVTIYGNVSESGAGLRVKRSNATLINCIVWGNTPEEIELNQGSVKAFYSNIEGGWTGEGNIATDPMFIEPMNNVFQLQSESPCIDAGTSFFVLDDDTLINFEPTEYFGISVDMGAFEYESTVSVLEKENIIGRSDQFSLQQNYPNPFNSETHICFTITRSSHVSIILYDLTGRRISTICDRKMEKGTHQVLLDTNNLSSGLYVYKMVAEHFSDAKVLTLIK